MFCSRKRHVKAQKEGNRASQKERGSLIFLHHNIKDSSYNSMNINKQLSPAENTPALQANKVDESWLWLGRDPQWFDSCKQPPPIRELEVLTLCILAGCLLEVWLYRVFSHDIMVAMKNVIAVIILLQVLVRMWWEQVIKCKRIYNFAIGRGFHLLHCKYYNCTDFLVEKKWNKAFWGITFLRTHAKTLS